jgi:type VI secretion system secreted protein Hcp
MLDIYLWFQEPTGGANAILGEAQDKELREKERVEPIKIKQFGFEIENITTIGSASGGASSGRCVLKPFTISKTTDSCSPDFFAACACGGHYGSATILLRKDNKPYIQYRFSMCFVTKVNWSGGESDETPSESIEFAYGALQIMYYPQLATGGMKSKPKITRWNQVNNSPTDTVTQH